MMTVRTPAGQAGRSALFLKRTPSLTTREMQQQQEQQQEQQQQQPPTITHMCTIVLWQQLGCSVTAKVRLYIGCPA
jgi:hypothetical protein